ncbi:glycosyltransferase family 4 protein [Sphingorhabdus sp.]|uniref:glycosyltransferase family 4 protein n=1 Tax=Sphingorhabdus sp. TaxID=1902408 RepID=UPI003BB123D4|nr:glycosyltransferase family 4 protein [Sphingomonadales bacterium]MBL0023158.1 glycosyltransferase family 4 protein [Sphingomonadales bacterium]
MRSPSAKCIAPTRRILVNGSYAPSLINFRGPLLRAMVEKGLEVHASAPDIPAEIADELAAIGVKAHSLPLQRTGRGLLGDIGYFRALRRLMSSIRPDCVLGYTVKPNIWGSIAAKVSGVRSYSWVTGLGYVFIEGDGLGRKATQFVARQLYRIATACNHKVIFQNPDDMADFIAHRCLADTSKTAMVNGSGVDTAHFSPAPLPDAPIFLLIARLLRSKGLAEYGDAVKLLKGRLPGGRFQLAGMLDEGPDAISQAELDALIASGIEYLGPLSDVRPAIAAASVYVLPSWREGTPRTVLEAMAMGRPIITNDVPGCRQTTVDGHNGLLVQPHDAQLLADAMERLGQDSAMRERMGQASLDRVREIYAVERVNAAMIDIMEIEAI